jgi:hypothetical protein
LGDRVRGQLVSGIGTGDSTLDVEITGAIWTPPPEPAPGRVGVVVLTDDLQSPGAVEVVHYTGTSDLGGGQWQLTGLVRGAVGTSAATWATGAHVLGPLTVAALAAPGRNLLVNPDGVIDQYLAAAAVADETYGPDRWCLLCDGSAFVLPASEAADYPIGAAGALKLECTGSGDKFAAVQYLEAADSAPVIGAQVSAQVRVKATGIAKIGLGIISWEGAADTLTRDCISAWGSVGAAPTLATDWTLEGYVIADAPTAWGDPITLEGVAIDTAGAANVGLLIWADDTGNVATDQLLLAGVKLEEGPRCTPYRPRPWRDEWLACLRWKQRSYLPGVEDGSTGAFRTYATVRYIQPAAVTKLAGLEVRFSPMMRTTPTITFYAPNSGTAGSVYNITTASDVGLASVHLTNKCATGAPIATSAPAAGDDLSAHYSAGVEL